LLLLLMKILMWKTLLIIIVHFIIEQLSFHSLIDLILERFLACRRFHVQLLHQESQLEVSCDVQSLAICSW
jgi:hypothetical protein